MALPGMRTRALPPDHTIRLRRAREEHLERHERAVADVFAATSRARWEQRMDRMLVAKRTDRRYKAMVEEEEERLNDRRRRLADLLNREQEMYEKELSSMVETPEQRRERLFARAAQLKEKREAKRRAAVREAEERRWRESSDDLRARDSALILGAVLEDRAGQLKEKRARKEAERAEEAKWAASWRDDMVRKKEREDREASKRRERDEEVKEELARQVELRKAMRAREQAKLDAEAAALKDEWAREEESRVLADERRRREKAEERAKVQAFNLAKRAEKDAMAARERAADLALLDEVLTKEREEAEREKEYARQLQREAKAYEEHLREQMRREALDESEIEKLRRAEMEKYWKKREDQWARQADARKRLMGEVDRARREQLDERARLAEIAREEDRIAAERMAAAAAEADAREAAAAKHRVDERLKVHSAVVEQMRAKEAARDAAKREEWVMGKHMERAERAYQERLRRMEREPPRHKSHALKRADLY
eukprot:PLAT6792.4.p1 GENE.PLAT6792.4~~PLAT6792.4.p1  ORF type:complete len:489 (-),score=290.14 PLAT6792.4:127-1593(-)